MLPNKFYKKQQESRLSASINLAGPRYTPKLNVGVSISPIFDAAGRTVKFYNELKKPISEITDNIHYIDKDELNKVIPKEFLEAKEHTLKVVSLLTKIPNSGTKKIEFKKIYSASNKAKASIYKCAQLLRKIGEEERKQKEQEKLEKKTSYYDSEKYRNETSYLYKIGSILGSLMDFSKSKTALAANNPRIILNGIAGSGKTHFLCDLSKHRIASGLPTFIFLGEEFNNSKDPLQTVKGLLGIKAENQKFLSALNKYAAAKHARVLIIVDAINESQTSGVHWEKFSQISRYKNLGVILSVRSGFEQSELSESVLKNYINIEHEGFTSHEWEALTKFFTEYNLPLPEIPILFPEFRVPLFLKIFCEASSKSKEPIKGHWGFSHIFEKYVIAQGEAVLNKLGEKGESVRRIWNGVIKELALYMGENCIDRISEKQALLIASKQFPKKGKEILGALEKYWLLTKVPKYKKYKIVGFDYRFPYQKFSDHLITRNLLNKHLDSKFPEKSFKKGTKLGDIIAHEWNRELIEALSIQVPERLLGRELVYVAPRKFRYQEVARSSFLKSLIWRDLSLKNGKPKYIKQRWVLNYLNKYISPYYYGKEEILETIISVSAIPDHPLNAKLLNRHLAKMKMPNRDAYWLPFINSHYGDESAVNRLLAWASDGSDKTKINNDSLRLASITLTWFLASSNRFLRDRTTKALILILNRNIPILQSVLDVFKNVDDAYIQERLYAVAYGCVLQADCKRDDVSNLAIQIYNNIFKDGKPPVHILLRDYARCAIETAISKDAKLKTKIIIKKIRPPYGSIFPKIIPTVDELKAKYYPDRKSRKPLKNGDYGLIWNSLMYNNDGGIADFGNYVVNSTIDHWKNLKLNSNGTRKKTVKEMDREFNDSLNKKQSKEWKRLGDIRSLLHWQRTTLGFSKADKEKLSVSKNLTKKELTKKEKIIFLLEKLFVRTLNREQQRLYRQGVLPYRKNSRESNNLNSSEIQRLIFQRIVELGWRPKLFSKYDSNVRESGRDARKMERIGKKYQWIAFHEILGRIADNFICKGGWSDDFEPYRGPWQMWERDIDPSCLLPKKYIDTISKRPWWINSIYKKWRPSLNHTKWTKVKNDLPDQKKLIEIKASGGWLFLDGYISWKKPPNPGEKEFSGINREVWYLLHSYIVKRKDANKIFTWAKKQDFMGRWMPDPLELHNIYLREIPLSIPYQNEYDEFNKKRWIKIENKERKITDFKVLRTTEEYHWEGNGFDCSVEDSVAIRIPAKELVKSMHLSHGKQIGKFINDKGEAVIQDPSLDDSGSGALLIKKKALLDFLKNNDYEIIWAVIGEKVLLGTFGGGDGFLGRLEVGGAYRMGKSGKLEGKSYSKVLPPHKK